VTLRTEQNETKKRSKRCLRGDKRKGEERKIKKNENYKRKVKKERKEKKVFEENYLQVCHAVWLYTEL
jgi:hypothetical protein